MKYLLSALCILFCLCLCACSSPAIRPEPSPAPLPELWEDTAATETLPEETISVTEPAAETSQQVVIAPALGEGQEGPLVLIPTDYFTLTLPHDWASTCIYTVTDAGNGAYCVNLYEAEAYWEFGGGNLCSLLLMPTGDNTYKDFPDYQLLAALDTPEGSFNVVALFPTDVQFTEATLQTYGTMFEQLPEVLSTITPVSGVEMAMP